ncbi:hypothetical protein EV360DRAFT_56968 [Lentinula raphanica]|nr:hypothetical protein EV360DRAFT_56968 [Lentinula raphanica]
MSLSLYCASLFVDFDKVYAALVSFSSSTYDDSRDFGSEYKLVRKDKVLKSVPVTSESQWLRAFDAWTAGIELETYKSQIMEYFRSSPYDPSVAIRVDKEARQKAANTPFDLGNPESFHPLLLKELLSARKRPSGGSSSSSSPSSKRRDTPCILWNEKRCSEPCPNNRKHGYCSECGEQHRAIDNQSCYDQLQKRRRESRKRSSRA